MVFEIRFPSYSGTPRCRPDSVLAGVVMLKNTRTISAKSLILTFKGVERINSNPSFPTYNSPAAQQLASNQWLEHIYFQRESILLGEGEESIFLEPGLHLYHFACSMPFMNYPSSIRSPQFEIVYTLTARLECPRDDVTKKLSLPAAIHFEPLPLVVPHLPESLKCFNTNVLDGDKVLFHLHANFMKNSFGPGEPFSMGLVLKPVTPRLVKSARVMLKEHVQCHLRNAFDHTEEPLWYNHRIIHHDILHLNRIASEMSRDPYVATVSFELPDFFQPNNSVYLSFNYTICIVLKVATGFLLTSNKEISVEVPITIIRPEKTPNPNSTKASSHRAGVGSGGDRTAGQRSDGSSSTTTTSPTPRHSSRSASEMSDLSQVSRVLNDTLVQRPPSPADSDNGPLITSVPAKAKSVPSPD
ncbi:hypothetical protein BJ085DRAFT_30917 [Dimargaris cristalligena]|uniref:Arrestin C-terminal-like domain-containing protein n=1 Tax=Dimargaris cristalligena TaxID=215637 RepID=A0A4P9ZWL0_9FUNG|nr:hypothetical protein BJ085DRAFT_30917 [Dimargaris cristalligena]|eukprot:RKP38055.1 hypothetical protein BJ085DRAFT_30917 [Dimargaris cristalligena]